MSAPEQQAIRFATLQEEHLDAIMDIEVEAYPEPWTRGMFDEEYRSPRSHFYVVFLGHEMTGYGGFWLVLDEAHITSVTVAKPMRGRGYGRALTEFLLDRAVAARVRMATLEVRASNVPAQKLYLSLGFRSVGLRKGYYPKDGEDAVVMLKELDASSDWTSVSQNAAADGDMERLERRGNA
jgi:ribosomal-protein-alanine N-acetyltransferase